MWSSSLLKEITRIDSEAERERCKLAARPYFIDARGDHIEKGPAQRMIGAALPRIKERARERIAVSFGESHVDAIIDAARRK